MGLGKMIKIFCDGSSASYEFPIVYDLNRKGENTLIGSYAILVLEYDFENNKHEILYEEQGGGIGWSSNIGELNGVLASLKYIKTRTDKFKQRFVIYSDSDYAIKSTLYYVKKWNINGYKLVSGLPVKNADLMREIYQTYYVDLKDVDITIQWIKSHQSNRQVDSFYNNVVDIRSKNKRIEVYKEAIKKFSKKT